MKDYSELKRYYPVVNYGIAGDPLAEMEEDPHQGAYVRYDDVREMIAEIERLRAALGKLRAEHRTCDHECTCAMISRIITQGTRCDCGADETNAIIDEALGI